MDVPRTDPIIAPVKRIKPLLHGRRDRGFVPERNARQKLDHQEAAGDHRPEGGRAREEPEARVPARQMSSQDSRVGGGPSKRTFNVEARFGIGFVCGSNS